MATAPIKNPTTFTMPNTSQGYETAGYQPYNPIASNQQGGMQDIADMKKEREQLVAQRDQLKQQLAQRKAFHAQNTFVAQPADQTDEDKQAMEEEQLRAGAEALMGWDAQAAYNMLQQAENLQVKRDAAKQKKDSESDIGSMDNIKQIAIQYRANMAQKMSPNWVNFSKEEKAQINSDITNNRAQLIKTELGRALVGEVDSVIPAVSKQEDRTDLSTVSATISNAVDKTGPSGKPDGIADNAADIDATLAKLRNKYSANDPDVQALEASWTTIKEILSTGRSQAEDIRKEKKVDADTQSKLAAEYGNLIDGINKLNADPTSVSAKSNLTNAIMRKLSGAAISPSEYADKIRDNLTAGDFKKFQDEVQMLGVGWSVVLPAETVRRILDPIAFRYLEKVDASKLISSANAIIDPRVRVKAGSSTAPIVVKKGTPRTAKGKKYEALRDLTQEESNKIENYKEVQ
jgi:hypothetical protein